MRSRGSRVFVFVAALTACLLVAIVPRLSAQDSVPTVTARLLDPDAGMVTISKRVDEVSLLFTVTDTKGRFVTDLNASDLQVFDNRLPPESIRLFQRESDLPLRVGLVVDLSESITQRFKFEKKAAATFLKKSLRPATDQAFVVGFNERVQLVQDFTNDSRRARDIRPEDARRRKYITLRCYCFRLPQAAGATPRPPGAKGPHPHYRRTGYGQQKHPRRRAASRRPGRDGDLRPRHQRSRSR